MQVVSRRFSDARKQPYSNFAVATSYRNRCTMVTPGLNLSIAGTVRTRKSGLSFDSFTRLRMTSSIFPPMANWRRALSDLGVGAETLRASQLATLH